MLLYPGRHILDICLASQGSCSPMDYKFPWKNPKYFIFYPSSDHTFPILCDGRWRFVCKIKLTKLLLGTTFMSRMVKISNGSDQAIIFDGNVLLKFMFFISRNCVMAPHYIVLFFNYIFKECNNVIFVSDESLNVFTNISLFLFFLY